MNESQSSTLQPQQQSPIAGSKIEKGEEKKQGCKTKGHTAISCPKRKKGGEGQTNSTQSSRLAQPVVTNSPILTPQPLVVPPPQPPKFPPLPPWSAQPRGVLLSGVGVLLSCIKYNVTIIGVLLSGGGVLLSDSGGGSNVSGVLLFLEFYTVLEFYGQQPVFYQTRAPLAGALVFTPGTGSFIARWRSHQAENYSYAPP
ncbi:hypothetical protein OUZ56_003244 [Daphnia magna]|uniref:Uncharacterized protein n=1 Tax=Daphnia magna TaxID=35525 RepID=A0ABR0A854_9CRUS|nr:hypothetical protein OUZ56_003244 [Daphnia magna]